MWLDSDSVGSSAYVQVAFLFRKENLLESTNICARGIKVVSGQLSAMDVLVPTSMKNAAKCDT